MLFCKITVCWIVNQVNCNMPWWLTEKNTPKIDENLILSKQRPSLDNKDLGNKICSETDYIMYIITYIYNVSLWLLAYRSVRSKSKADFTVSFLFLLICLDDPFESNSFVGHEWQLDPLISPLEEKNRVDRGIRNNVRSTRNMICVYRKSKISNIE